jgi:hypothetical protein
LTKVEDFLCTEQEQVKQDKKKKSEPILKGEERKQKDIGLPHNAN